MTLGTDSEMKTFPFLENSSRYLQQRAEHPRPTASQASPIDPPKGDGHPEGTTGTDAATAVGALVQKNRDAVGKSQMTRVRLIFY